MSRYVQWFLAGVIASVMWACVPRLATVSHINDGRYSIVGCKPDLQVCLVFDSATGDIVVRPMPNLPKTGELEVRKKNNGISKS